VRRPALPWLERESTNRDAIVLFALGLVLPLMLGVLDATKVVKTLAVGAWLAVGVGFLLLAIVYRMGGASVRRTLPVDTDRYVEHVTDAIETMQKVASGTIAPIEVAAFVQEGIFEPAQTILSQRGRGDVRFSVLEPVGDSFEMALALAHSIESRRAFELKVIGSFAGMTYADGAARYSNDTDNDDRFTPHPQARAGREYASIITVPIREGHDVVGVFVVVAQQPKAFSAADVAYASQLGALIGLARALATPKA
jgi:GAF domain-containing protein